MALWISEVYAITFLFGPEIVKKPYQYCNVFSGIFPRRQDRSTTIPPIDGQRHTAARRRLNHHIATGMVV